MGAVLKPCTSLLCHSKKHYMLLLSKMQAHSRKISKVLHLSTDFLLFGEKPGETADQISLMLSQCSSKRRAYAEQILKIFLISDEE